MTKRRLYASFLFLLAGSVALLFGAGLRGRAPDLKTARQVARRARIRPDYADIVVPPNIAPLNFVIQEPAKRYHVRIGSVVGPPVEVASRDGKVEIPLRAWRRLLTANTDREFSIQVFALAEDGQWDVFEPALNKVAAEPVDPYLFYRFINSVFTMWVDVSMHERRLEDFEERLIVDSDALNVGCVNCHTFLHGRPDTMLLHMRHGPLPAGYGSGMVMVREGKVSLVDTRTPQSLGPAGFTTWHRSGRLMVFSMNRVTQFFHGATTEVREVVDSGLGPGRLLPGLADRRLRGRHRSAERARELARMVRRWALSLLLRCARVVGGPLLRPSEGLREGPLRADAYLLRRSDWRLGPARDGALA